MAKDFLGSGWKFPLGLDKTGRFELVAEEADIREAILTILNTAPGERVMRPDFGCGIHDYVFAVLNSATFARIEQEIARALGLFEPRIRVEQVKAEADAASGEGRLLIGIDYTVKASNSRHNMVYPFYLTEKG